MERTVRKGNRPSDMRSPPQAVAGVLLLALCACAGCAFPSNKTNLNSIHPCSDGYWGYEFAKPPPDVQARVANYLESHPKTDEQTREHLLQGGVSVGMTKAQVTLVLSNPDLVTKNSESEVWIYRIHGMRGLRYVQVIVPIPTGRQHYTLTFKNELLERIDFAGEWVLQD